VRPTTSVEMCVQNDMYKAKHIHDYAHKVYDNLYVCCICGYSLAVAMQCAYTMNGKNNCFAPLFKRITIGHTNFRLVRIWIAA
jgi:hypothetical protein